MKKSETRDQKSGIENQESEARIKGQKPESRIKRPVDTRVIDY
jgi:hypothetical protein